MLDPPRPTATTDRRLVRDRGDDLAAVPAALRSEWIKLRSLRSTPGILALTVVVGVLLSWILATFVKTDPEHRTRSSRSGRRSSSPPG